MREERRENSTAKAAVMGVSQFNIGLIFTLFMKEVKGGLDIFKLYVLFPLVALTDIITAYFAWRDAKRTAYRDADLLHKAAVEIFCAIAVALAIFLSVLSTAGVITISTLVVPIMFSAVMFFKTVDRFIHGCICLIKSKPAGPDFVNAVNTGLITVAVSLVMIAGLTTWASLGIMASLLGIGLALYTGFKSCIQRWRQEEEYQIPSVSSPSERAAERSEESADLLHYRFDGDTNDFTAAPMDSLTVPDDSFAEPVAQIEDRLAALRAEVEAESMPSSTVNNAAGLPHLFAPEELSQLERLQAPTRTHSGFQYSGQIEEPDVVEQAQPQQLP